MVNPAAPTTGGPSLDSAGSGLSSGNRPRNARGCAAMRQNRLPAGTVPAIQMRVQTVKTLLFCFFTLGALGFGPALAQGADDSGSRFFYRDIHGRVVSAPVMHRFWRRRIIHPLAQVDPRINPKLMRAATLAEERANAHSKGLCWRYVKTALLESGAINSYPK